MPQALVALVGWTLFAFAGAYQWTLVPVIAGAAMLALTVRPRVAVGPHVAVDLGLIACLLATAAQIVPIPVDLHAVLSPATMEVDRALLVGSSQPVVTRALSLDPSATTRALATGVTLVATFWSARAIFERGGLRTFGRGVGLWGLALAAIALVQHARTPHLIYGFWAPVTRTANPMPYGPFVNRNDFAAWLILALPLVAGYGLARVQSRLSGRSPCQLSRAIELTLDTTTVVMSASVALMTAALVASMSRSGLAGGAAATAVVLLLGQRRLGIRHSLMLVAAAVGVLAVSLQYANLTALASRLSDSLPGDVQGRMEIWQSTWPMARDFLGVGVGAGAFERGMLAYQQGSREVFFNHAHNEFLQLLAEGGLLIGGPMALTMAAACRRAVGAVLADRSPAFWLRAGAVGSLAAVAIQSLWDTGLRMPANAVLFAVIAAIALHERP